MAYVTNLTISLIFMELLWANKYFYSHIQVYFSQSYHFE